MGKECEKDGGYWDSNTEMTARAFACYIKDKLPYASDYLVGHADSAVTLITDGNGKMDVLKAFPEGEERKAINAVFDEVMAELKREQILTHAETTLPLPASEFREAKDGQLSMFGAERTSILGQLNVSKEQKKAGVSLPRKKEEPQL